MEGKDNRINKKSGINGKRKRGYSKGLGPKNESSSTKYRNVQTQRSELPTSSTTENVKRLCSELPSSIVGKTECSESASSAVHNHQMPSVHFEKIGTSAVGNTGTETEAANRNIVDEFYSMQMENTKLDTDQTLDLVPEMSNNPTNEIGLESKSACTENIAVGTVVDFVCASMLSPTIEEHQTLFPTLNHANQATESKAGMDVTNGEINQAQLMCPSILENPLVLENNEDIQDTLDEAIEERDTPLDSVMDLQQPSIVPQNSPPLVIHEEQQIQPIVKSSMLGLLERLEVFRIIPQNPHFLPLENEPEFFREMKAFDYTCLFESFVRDTDNASIKEDKCELEYQLNRLNLLEENGFNVSSLRWQLKKMIEMKDKLL